MRDGAFSCERKVWTFFPGKDGVFVYLWLLPDRSIAGVFSALRPSSSKGDLPWEKLSPSPHFCPPIPLLPSTSRHHSFILLLLSFMQLASSLPPPHNQSCPPLSSSPFSVPSLFPALSLPTRSLALCPLASPRSPFSPPCKHHLIRRHHKVEREKGGWGERGVREGGKEEGKGEGEEDGRGAVVGRV